MTLLAVAGCNYIMGVPGADDIMLDYQSTSFHDALYLRRVLGLRPAPEFEEWLNRMGIFDGRNAWCGLGGLLEPIDATARHPSGDVARETREI